MKKLLAVLLASAMLASTFSACSSSSSQESSSTSSSGSDTSTEEEEEEEDRELDIVIAYTETQAEQDDVYSWEYLADITNVTLNIESKLNVGTSITEYKQLMFNTDMMPDIMINCGITSSDVTTYGISEGQKFFH